MRIAGIIALLLVGCGGAASESPSTVKVHLTLVTGTGSITEAQALTVFDNCQQRFESQLLRSLELVGLESMPALPAHQYNPTDQRHMFFYYRHFDRENERSRHGVINYYILPPYIDAEGNRTFGGVAEGTCLWPNKGMVAVGNAAEWSSHTPPRDRLNSAAIIMCHEIGHLVGMHHVSGTREIASIMHPAAGAYADDFPGMAYNNRSIVEANSCIGSRAEKALRTAKRLKNRARKLRARAKLAPRRKARRLRARARQYISESKFLRAYSYTRLHEHGLLR